MKTVATKNSGNDTAAAAAMTNTTKAAPRPEISISRSYSRRACVKKSKNADISIKHKIKHAVRAGERIENRNRTRAKSETKEKARFKTNKQQKKLRNSGPSSVNSTGTSITRREQNITTSNRIRCARECIVKSHPTVNDPPSSLGLQRPPSTFVKKKDKS